MRLLIYDDAGSQVISPSLLCNGPANLGGIDQVIAEVLPGDEAAKVAELQQQGRKVAAAIGR
jgi:hypothetical protein